jgi:hypothetical protein
MKYRGMEMDEKEVKLMNFVKDFPRRKLSNKANVLEALEYDNTSLWWFLEYDFFIATKRSVAKQKTTSSKLGMAVVLFIIAKALVRWLYSKIFFAFFRLSDNRQKILFISYLVEWRKSVNPFKKHEEDIIFQPIVDVMKKKYNCITVDQDTSFGVQFRKMVRRSFIEKEAWKPIEFYLSFGILFSAIKSYFHFRNVWNEIKEDKLFRNNFYYGSKNRFNDICPIFENAFNFKLLHIILLYEMTKRAVRIERPKSIAINCEYGAFGRAGVVAGNLYNVPTIALQHGLVSPYQISYFHQEWEVDEKIKFYCILPDKTSVYGKYVKEILDGVGRYPKGSVVFTGQPRYDILAKADKFFDKNEIMKRYSINPKKKMILITTQPLPSMEEREIFLRTVLDGLKVLMQEHPDCQVVIKPHPNENKEWHENIVKEKGMDVVILPSWANTFEILYTCDVLLSYHSTTAFEAMILDKPVVIVNLFSKSDVMPFVSSGSAFGAYDGESIPNVVYNALTNKKLYKSMERNRKKFIYENCYKTDGKASERVAKLIEGGR